MNLKIVAKFKEPVRAENGTIFTVQVQEFERQGLLMMASTFRRHYLASSFLHLSAPELDAAMRDYDHLGIFAAMIRPKSRARVISWLGSQPIVTYRFAPEDVPLVKTALMRMSELLLASGAEELYLPIPRLGKIRSLDELERKLEGLSPRQVEIVTVHTMASCAMGENEESSVVNPDGKVWGTSNVWVADASVLPTNIGESPQGTIMAFAHAIMERHLSSASRSS